MTIEYSPSMKYVNVISAFSSKTCTAFSAEWIPPEPLRNLPGPIQLFVILMQKIEY